MGEWTADILWAIGISSSLGLSKRFDFLVVLISANLPQVVMISTGDDENLFILGS